MSAYSDDMLNAAQRKIKEATTGVRQAVNDLVDVWVDRADGADKFPREYKDQIYAFMTALKQALDNFEDA